MIPLPIILLANGFRRHKAVYLVYVPLTGRQQTFSSAAITFALNLAPYNHRIFDPIPASFDCFWSYPVFVMSIGKLSLPNAVTHL